MSKLKLNNGEIQDILNLYKKLKLKESKNFIKEEINQKCLVKKPDTDPYNVYTSNVSYFYDPTTKKCEYGQGSTGFPTLDECNKTCAGTETTSETTITKDQIKTGFKFANGLEILKEPTVYNNDDGSIIVFLPTQDGGNAGNQFYCDLHKKDKYFLIAGTSKSTLTKSESKALYDKYCQTSNGNTGELRDFIVPIFPSSEKEQIISVF